MSADTFKITIGWVSKNSSEKQIEMIQERLCAIEKFLKIIAHRSSDHDGIQSSATPANRETSSNLTSFEGESSFNNETLQASRAASSILSTNQDPAVKSALSSLHENLSTIGSSLQQDGARHHNESTQQKISLLPAALVIALVKKAKGCPDASCLEQKLTISSGSTTMCCLK